MYMHNVKHYRGVSEYVPLSPSSWVRLDLESRWIKSNRADWWHTQPRTDREEKSTTSAFLFILYTMRERDAMQKTKNKQNQWVEYKRKGIWNRNQSFSATAVRPPNHYSKRLLSWDKIGTGGADSLFLAVGYRQLIFMFFSFRLVDGNSPDR